MVQRPSLTTTYGGFNVVTHAAPSSGASLLETLNVLRNLPPLAPAGAGTPAPNAPGNVHLIGEAPRVVGQDWSFWLGDPSSPAVPPNNPLVPCSG